MKDRQLRKKRSRKRIKVIFKNAINIAL